MLHFNVDMQILKAKYLKLTLEQLHRDRVFSARAWLVAPAPRPSVKAPRSKSLCVARSSAVAILEEGGNGSTKPRSEPNSAELLPDSVDPAAWRTDDSGSAAPNPPGSLSTDIAGSALTEAEKAKLMADNFFLRRRRAELEEQLRALNIEIARLENDPATEHLAAAMPRPH
jgi:hypothetical protein